MSKLVTLITKGGSVQELEVQDAEFFVYPPYVLNEEGELLLEEDGAKIPHPQAGELSSFKITNLPTNLYETIWIDVREVAVVLVKDLDAS